jgi:phage shock protein E
LRTITHRDVLRLIAERAQVVDVLPAHEYRVAHIRGAIHLPLARLRKEAACVLTKDRPIVVYCRDAL